MDFTCRWSCHKVHDIAAYIRTVENPDSFLIEELLKCLNDLLHFIQNLENLHLANTRNDFREVAILLRFRSEMEASVRQIRTFSTEPFQVGFQDSIRECIDLIEKDCLEYKTLGLVHPID